MITEVEFSFIIPVMIPFFLELQGGNDDDILGVRSTRLNRRNWVLKHCYLFLYLKKFIYDRHWDQNPSAQTHQQLKSPQIEKDGSGAIYMDSSPCSLRIAIQYFLPVRNYFKMSFSQLKSNCSIRKSFKNKFMPMYHNLCFPTQVFLWTLYIF